MPQRPCIDCGRLTPNTRCPTHARAIERRHTQAKRAKRPYTNAERIRRARTVEAWRRDHGDWCPGLPSHGRPAHHATPANPLTADHEFPVNAGGPEDGPLVVRCRQCNSVKRDWYAGRG